MIKFSTRVGCVGMLNDLDSNTVEFRWIVKSIGNKMGNYDDDQEVEVVVQEVF